MSSASDRDPTEGQLGKKTIGGGLSTVFMQGSVTFINLAGLMVLARIVPPADFGLIAKVTVLTGLVMLIGDMGLTVATIQSKSITDRQLSALFWVNVIVSAAIGGMIVLSAPLIGLFYDDPRVILVAVALGFNVLIAGLGVQHVAILRRQMRFSAIAITKILGTLIGVGVAIVAALWLTNGYWALLLQLICGTFASTVGAWMCSGWRPSFHVRRAGIRDHLKMGGNFTLSNFINYFCRNGDNVLIAKFWGEQSLAFYAKAYSLLLLPIRQIAGPLNQVAVPALSRLQSDPEKYRAFFRKGVSISMILQIPITVFAAIAGRELVLTILGSKWEESIPIFYALIPNLLASATTPATQWVFLSRGDTGRLVKMVAFNSLFVLLGFVIGLPYGPVGVAWSYSITTCVLRVPSILYCFKGSPVTARDFFSTMTGPAFCSVVAGLLAIVSGFYVSASSTIIILAVKFTCFFGAYLGLILTTSSGRDVFHRLFRYFRPFPHDNLMPNVIGSKF